MRIGMQIIEELTGQQAWAGTPAATARTLADWWPTGGFEYDSDYYGDDLPFWTNVTRTDGHSAPHLIVPYTLDVNDMRFSLPQGFSQGDDFFTYLRDTFDVLYEEGNPQGLNSPKMMSVGMHCRLLGRPGRMRALQRFLDHIERHDGVWVARRIDIARHWRAPPYSVSSLTQFGNTHGTSLVSVHKQGSLPAPLTLAQLNVANPASFIQLLHGVYEHSPGLPIAPGQSNLSDTGPTQIRPR